MLRIFTSLMTIALVVPLGSFASAENPLFPFLVSYDSPDNATNVSPWLPSPAGRDGRVRIVDGHFANDKGPIRFWATNLCFEACFPTHEQADRVAARLARFGINCVRMHHMDSRSIWDADVDKLTLDPEKLERLDYLIYKLKEHGIYTNINLHVSRSLGPKEGFPEQGGRPKYDKGIDNFHPRMIELQKKYARDLLTHVNPYTKTAYTNEPSVAMVEINNENALFNQWSRHELDDLSDPYDEVFRRQWNEWLIGKYQTTENLKEAWNAGSMPLGKELIVNGDFSNPQLENWSLQQDGQAKVSHQTVADGVDGQPLLRIEVARSGNETWIPQLFQAGISVNKDMPYTLSFKMRATKPQRVSVNCMMAREPYKRLGLSEQFQVESTWKTFEFTFLSSENHPNSRITLSSFPANTYELAQVSLRPGGVWGVQAEQRLEDFTIPVQVRGQRNFTEQSRRDFIDFLWDTESDYWLGFYRFLKEDLEVKSPISGTQVGYSPTNLQSQLDYLDSHAYWHHPVFPGRSWDARNWYVNDLALVNQPGGTLTKLAAGRVHDQPYTVSEYNHPSPNTYEGEGLPMFAAFAAMQSWDGIFSFSYGHDENFEPTSVQGYFDVKANAVKLVHHPACAAMFLRGDVSPAKKMVVTSINEKIEREGLYETGNPWHLNGWRLGTDPNVALEHAVGLGISESAKISDAATASAQKKNVFVSDTGQLTWDISQPDAGFFTVDTPRTKLFTGFVKGRVFKLGNVQLKIGETLDDWSVVSMVCLDGEGFDRSGRILIAASGRMQNSDAKRDRLPENRVTLQRGWGTAPLLCEGVRAEIVLPVAADHVKLYALDSSGNRKNDVAVESSNGDALLKLSPEQQTLWYEAVVQE